MTFTMANAEVYTPFESNFLPPESDPYLYGWRIIERMTATGAVILEQVPLTLEDVLHPQEGDFRVHSTDHNKFCHYLQTVFINQVKDTPTTRVFHDVRVKWKHPRIKAHGPDVSVVFNVNNDKNWSTFDMAVEDAEPALVVEVVSPSTRMTDIDIKVGEYAAVGIPFYVIIDRQINAGEDLYILRAYELDGARYKLMDHNPEGRVWIPPVNCWIGIEENRVACFSRSGVRLLSGPELDDKLRTVAVDLEQEKARAEQEKARAEQEKARAEQEAVRANAAEAEIARLKALLEQHNA